MSNKDSGDISFDEFDEIDSDRPQETQFDQVVEEAISRRGFLGGTLAFSTGAFLMGTTALTPTSASAAAKRFGFEAIPAGTDDTIIVPKGFSWHSVVNWGDPLWSNGIDFDQKTRGTGESQEMAFGDNNDGMSLFAHGGKSIMVVNNEYTNRSIIYGNRETKLPENA
ncbi:MAG: alkaline phosphatase PhoX, partial [Bacteroidota bacterium]